MKDHKQTKVEQEIVKQFARIKLKKEKSDKLFEKYYNDEFKAKWIPEELPDDYKINTLPDFENLTTEEIELIKNYISYTLYRIENFKSNLKKYIINAILRPWKYIVNFFKNK